MSDSCEAVEWCFTAREHPKLDQSLLSTSSSGTENYGQSHESIHFIYSSTKRINQNQKHLKIIKSSFWSYFKMYKYFLMTSFLLWIFRPKIGVSADKQNLLDSFSIISAWISNSVNNHDKQARPGNDASWLCPYMERNLRWLCQTDRWTDLTDRQTAWISDKRVKEVLQNTCIDRLIQYTISPWPKTAEKRDF